MIKIESTGIETMLPLYPADGGPARGYTCRGKVMRGQIEYYCGAVTRTQRGMWAHLRLVHGIRKQAKLFEESADILKAPITERPMDL